MVSNSIQKIVKMSIKPEDLQKDLQRHLYEHNKNGLTPVHEASSNGYINAVKRYVTNAYDRAGLLEVVTNDHKAVTAILLAALGSHLDIVKFLYESGANLHAKNSSGDGICEMAILRQDFKMLNFLIELMPKESQLDVWQKLLKLLNSKQNEKSASAGRCLERLTDINSYKTDEFTEYTWKHNCKSLIANKLYTSLSKALIESSRDTVISSIIVLMNMINFGSHTKMKENVKIFLTENGYQCLVALIDKIEKLDDDLVTLVSKLLRKLSDCQEKCEYFSNHEFKDMPLQLFDSLIKRLEKIREPLILYAFTDFMSNLIEFNPKMNIDLNNLKALTIIIISFLKLYHNNDNLMASLLRLISLLATCSSEIQNLLIEMGLSSFLIESLKSDVENLKILAIECIIQCCKSNVYVQKALFKQKVDEMLLNYLSKYLERIMKTLAMTAVWSIAGDDLLQRKIVCKKISLDLLNECVSDQEGDLYVTACNALIVLFEQPPTTKFWANQRFIKIEMVPIKLMRILANEHPNNVLSALRCIKKLCSTCGENGYKQPQRDMKNADILPHLITLIIHAKQPLVRAEAASTLAYVCLENKENTKITFETLKFSFHEIFDLLRINSHHIKQIITKSLAVFAFNNLDQEANIAQIGMFNFNLFREYLNMPNEIDRCEGAYQIVLLSQLIYNQEHTKLVALGIGVLISNIEKANSDFPLKCHILEMIAGLSKLKNGVAEALLAINIFDILCDGSLINDINLEGYIAIILSNLSFYPDGRRKLLKKCRKNPHLFKILENYCNYQEGKYRLPDIFMKEWDHLKSLIE